MLSGNGSHCDSFVFQPIFRSQQDKKPLHNCDAGAYFETSFDLVNVGILIAFIVFLVIVLLFRIMTLV